MRKYLANTFNIIDLNSILLQKIYIINLILRLRNSINRNIEYISI